MLPVCAAHTTCKTISFSAASRGALHPTGCTSPPKGLGVEKVWHYTPLPAVSRLNAVSPETLAPSVGCRGSEGCSGVYSAASVCR